MKLIDDSEKVINYYIRLYANHKDKSILQRIIQVMQTWSIIVKEKKIDTEQIGFLQESLSHSNEVIWFEIGSRIAPMTSKDHNAIKLFREGIRYSKSQMRFNIVALAKYLAEPLRKEIIEIAVNDKSQKVIIKAADVILGIQERKYLELLKERLKVEKNDKIREAIEFALNYFDKMKRDKKGILHLSSES